MKSDDLIVKEIIDYVKSELDSKIHDNLLSYFIVGSMVNHSYKFRQKNDLDLRIVLAKMNFSDYDTICSIMETIAKKMTCENLVIFTNDIIGPLEYSDGSNKSLYIHYIILTDETLNGLPLLHKYSYSQSYRLIFGEDLLEKFKNVKYSAQDICYNAEGLFYCLDMINNRKLKYLRWTFESDIMKLKAFEVKMKDEVLLEMLRYSLFKTLRNCHAWLIWQGTRFKSGEMEEIFETLNIDVESSLVSDLKSLERGEYLKLDLQMDLEIKIKNILILIANSILRMEKYNL